MEQPNSNNNNKNPTINLSNCKYEVLKTICKRNGLQISKDQKEWTIWWMDNPGKLTQQAIKNIKPNQRVNHFPAMTEIAVKNHLARNLNRMRKLFPEEYNFHPSSYLWPKDEQNIKQDCTENPGKAFIVKAAVSSEGRGISVTNSEGVLSFLNTINESNKELLHGTVVQQYIQNPLLLDEFKFDLRLYVLISSIEPLRIFLYKEGLVRVCTSKYENPAPSNFENSNMHLSNYTVNKKSQNFNANESETIQHKRTFSWFISYLELQYGKQKMDKVLDDICDLISKTIIAIQPSVASLNRSLFPSDCNNASFELLGFDVLVDTNLKPWILEVNQSPSLSMDTPVDVKVKEALIEDSFKLLGFIQANSGQTGKFWRIFPSQRIGDRFAKLFVFPFPEEMLNQGEFLNTKEIEDLKEAINK